MSPSDPIAAVRRYIEEKTSAGEIDRDASGWRTRLPIFPDLEFDRSATCFWTVETPHGTVRVRLLSDSAPRHVANFIYLTELGFFDELSFHRVIPGFMAQGGCPLGTGTGSPGYRFAGEFEAEVGHDRPGLLSMANAGPGTDGSQFFLTFAHTPWLDAKHTVFGEVTGGLEALRELEKRGSPSGAPTEPLAIVSARIEQEG